MEDKSISLSIRKILATVSSITLLFGGFSVALGLVHYNECSFTHDNILFFLIVGAVFILLGISTTIMAIKHKA